MFAIEERPNLSAMRVCCEVRDAFLGVARFSIGVLVACHTVSHELAEGVIDQSLARPMAPVSVT
jgi:hypothetical protein